MTSTSESPTPLLNTVLDEIGAEIVSGAIETGQRFTLQDICVRFDISRTVAREAMRALEQLGMVSSSRRVGITVLPLSEWSVFDQSIINWRLACEASQKKQLNSLNQLRLAIEPIAARMAATESTEEEREEILELAERLHELEMKPSRRVGEELATDLRFHSMVLHASGNEMFAALTPSLLSMLKGKSVFGSEKRNPIAGTAHLHQELARAIAEQRPDEAETIARSILDEARASAGAKA
ncbi:bacterial regulatory s, gntR family protein [Corynebacterium simulans]|uniref:FadR/GntR family transcriptional regulator n=1 Tax=Corynebacterium TaxID=1716 RepID=UPI0007823A4A|nr:MULTISPECIES: FCD domain-containing protein [Corynebacterium]AMO89613.1 bacterial regulatory s, gntR family protein [Corynebacterium simulans]OFT45949.1 transcriptional regulator [Corynebacterium sp. HMSC06G04]